MIHAGIGETHVNALLTTIGLPSISCKTLKKMERIIGPLIEAEAIQRCTDARKDEYDIAYARELERMETVDQITFDEAMSLLESPHQLGKCKISIDLPHLRCT